MKIFRPILVNVLGIIGFMVALGYLLSGFSQYISPALHPVFSCLGLFFPFAILANAVMVFVWLFVKWKYAVVHLLVFALGWGPLRTYTPFNFSSAPLPDGCIKVLSYNVMGFHKDKDGHMGALDYIRQSDADIICLQEFTAHQTEVVRAMSAYKYHEVIKLRGGNSLACFSRFPIVEVETFEFPQSFNGCTLFRLRKDGSDILVVNNHFESNKLDSKDKEMYKAMLKSLNDETIKKSGKHLLQKYAEASGLRARQADIVKKAIALKGCDKVIACGDFNDTPLSYVCRRMSEGLTDAYLECGFGPGISYNRSFMFFRIDNMLVSSNFKVFRCQVDRSTDASDHYPIWCIIKDKLSNE